nr:putative prephenate dehydrogenase [nadp(+)] [Quercus suber]
MLEGSVMQAGSEYAKPLLCSTQSIQRLVRNNALSADTPTESTPVTFQTRQPNVSILKNGHLVSRSSDWIMYSVEAKNIDAVVATYGPSTKFGAIVGGQTSTKAPEIAAFEKHLPADVEIVSCHSLHGPAVDPKGQPLVIIKHRATDNSVERVTQMLSCFRSKVVYLSAAQHDRITADTQAVTHAAFLSMGVAWQANDQFPWEIPRYIGGIENVKINITLRIYSNKWHVYAGLAILNPSAKAQIRQYAESVTELFKLMLSGNRKELTERVYSARAAVFGHNRGGDELLLDDRLLDRFSLGTKPAPAQRVRNNHLSLLAMVDCWWKLGIVPYDHMICSTPLFRLWLGITEYIYRGEALLAECIDTAIEDQSFRADDLEFTFAARDWSERVSLGNMEGYRMQFEKMQRFFEPRFHEATKVGNEMIKTIEENLAVRRNGKQIQGESELNFKAQGSRKSTEILDSGARLGPTTILMEKSRLFCLPNEVLVSIMKELGCVKSMQSLALAGIKTVRLGGRNYTDSQISNVARETLRKQFHILYIEPNRASLERALQICASPDHAKEITELRWVATLHQRTWQEVMSSSSSSRHMCADTPASILGEVLYKYEMLRLEQNRLLETGEFDQALQACLETLPLNKICIETDPWMTQHFPNDQPNLCDKAVPCTYVKMNDAYNRPKYWQHSHNSISVKEQLDQKASVFQQNELLFNLHYGPRLEPWTFDNPFRLFRALFAAKKQLDIELVMAGHLDLLTEDRVNSFKIEHPKIYQRVMSMINAVTIQLDNARCAYEPNETSRRALPLVRFLVDSSITRLTVRGFNRTHEEFLNRLIVNLDGTRHLPKLTSLYIWFPDRWHYASERRINLEPLLSIQPYTTAQLWRFLAAHKSTLREVVLFNCLGCDMNSRRHAAEDLRQLLKRVMQQLRLTSASILIDMSVWFDILDIGAMADDTASLSTLVNPQLGSSYPPPFWNLKPLPYARDRAREADSDLGQLARRLNINRPQEYHAHRCAKTIKVVISFCKDVINTGVNDNVIQQSSAFVVADTIVPRSAGNHAGTAEDPRGPTWKKYCAWIPLIPLDLCVSIGASGFSPATTKFAEAFDVSTTVAILGLSMYTLALALGPMINAPLSEYFGRLPIWIISPLVSFPFFVGSALSPNLGSFLVTRFFAGLFQSVTIANLGGTIADVYTIHETGYPMSIFVWAATAGSSIGYFLMAFVAQYRPWYDVIWALLGILGGVYLIMACFILYCGETRHGVLLRRRATRIRRETGENVDVPEEYRRKDFKQLLLITQTRPFRFLFMEPIVLFAALYNAYLYGITFLLNGALNLVFGMRGHGFDTIQVGLCFLGIAFGLTVGPFTNIIQERYYRRRVREIGGHGVVPEARVRMAKIAAITFPVSLFWFAWTTYPSIHPVVPILGIALWGWSFFTILLMTYTYIEDSYKDYSASALAGLGFIRNIAGGGFPLFGNQMFENEGYQWAGSILAFLALVLVPIPFILEKYGETLRRRSPWAAQHMEKDGTQKADTTKSEAPTT